MTYDIISGVNQAIEDSVERNDIQKVMIYLMKKSGGFKSGDWSRVGGMSGFAAAKAYRRLIAETFKDGALRKKDEKMAVLMSRVKGLTTLAISANAI